MTTAQLLDQIAAANNLLIENKGFLKSLFGGSTLHIGMSSGPRPEQEAKEILDWFCDGGKLESDYKSSVPYGERKNSKKRNITTFYLINKNGIASQIAHETVYNYTQTWMERGIEALVKGAICKAGEFSYQNGSYLSYVLSKGMEVVNLGEKK